MEEDKDKKAEELTGRFYKLYQSNGRSVGKFDPKTGKMHTAYQQPTPEDFRLHLRGTDGVGCVPILDDNTCTWAAIDIDNHGQDEDIPIGPVDEKITLNSLPLIACRSKSGGIHCYIFFSDPQPASKVRSLLEEFARLVGYAGSEIFPKQAVLRAGQDGTKQLGNWINLPYLGADRTNRYAYKNGKKLRLEEFLSIAESLKLKSEDLRKFLLIGYDGSPPCVRQMIELGVDSGQRNEAMFNVVVFLRKAEMDIKNESTRLNGQIFTKPLPRAELTRTVLSASRPEYSYRCSEEPMKTYCNREACLESKFGISVKEYEEVTAAATLPVFSDLIKYIAEPVRWEMKIDGKRVTNIQTPQLLDWRAMREIIADKLTKIVPMIKATEWERILDPIMKEARIYQTPDDASTAGVIRQKLKEFASKTDLTNRGGNTDDRKALTRGMPCVQLYDGDRCVMFRAQDFVNFLKRTKSEELKGMNLWFAVRDMGCLHTKLRAGNHNINVWAIPVETVLADEPEPDPIHFKSDL